MIPRMSMIVAVADNGVIGGAGDMVWNIRSETLYFKSTTIGKPVIHGRKSFEALGKPLPKRPNIVVTRDTSYMAEGVTIAHTIDDAISVARDMAVESGVDEFFIAGGAEIYKLALPMTDRLYFTEVHMQPEGETVFPAFDKSEWTEIKSEFHAAEPGEDADYTIKVYDRLR